MIDAPSGRSWTASSTTRRCSSSVSVEASPVVPHTTNPSDPCAARWCNRSTNACSSTLRSSSNGVTIAVRMAPSPATSLIVPGSARKRIAARQLGRRLMAAVDGAGVAGGRCGGRGGGGRRIAGGGLGGGVGHRVGGLGGRLGVGRGRLRVRVLGGRGHRRRRRAALLLALVE